MARKRMSTTEAQEAITSRIQAAGGTLAHNDLVNQLEQEGNGDAVGFLLLLSQNKVISGRVVAQAEGKPRLEYSLSEGSNS